MRAKTVRRLRHRARCLWALSLYDKLIWLLLLAGGAAILGAMVLEFMHVYGMVK
jgi:hypothetical protein